MNTIGQKPSVRSGLIRNFVVTKQQIPDDDFPEWPKGCFRNNVRSASTMTTLTLFIKPSSRNVLIRDLAVINWSSWFWRPAGWGAQLLEIYLLKKSSRSVSIRDLVVIKQAPSETSPAAGFEKGPLLERHKGRKIFVPCAQIKGYVQR